MASGSGRFVLMRGIMPVFLVTVCLCVPEMAYAEGGAIRSGRSVCGESLSASWGVGEKKDIFCLRI